MSKGDPISGSPLNTPITAHPEAFDRLRTCPSKGDPFVA